MIRDATFADIDELTALLIAHGEQSVFYRDIMGIEPDRVKTNLTVDVVNNKTPFVVYVNSDGVITAFVRAIITEYYGSSKKYCSDLMLVTHADYRGQGHAVRVMKYVHLEMQDAGVHAILMLDTADVDTAGVDRLLTDLGYTAGGRVYRGVVDDLQT